MVPKILTVGSTNIDIIASDLLFDERPSKTVVYQDYAMKCGGKGLNQACTVSMLGGESYFVGKVGSDAFGRMAIDMLQKHKVGISHLAVDPSEPTGVSFIGVAEDGTYSLFQVMGATARMTVEEVENALNAARYDMILMQFEMPQEVVYRTYEIAREKGIPVILDAGPARRWPLQRLRDIFMISPNADETCTMTGIYPKDEESALAASQSLYEATHAQYILLKMGAKGAYLYSQDLKRMFPTFDFVSAVDSTGCGDVFTATVALKLCQGCSIEEAVLYGNAAASISCTRVGGIDSVPDSEEIETFVAENRCRV